MFVIDGVEMLDVRAAALLARRTPETVRRWVWSGRIPAIRQGNRLLVSRHDVEDVVRGVGRSPEPPTLATWARQVDDCRRTGALPRARRGSSAADLVVSDRRSRDNA